MLFLLTPKHAFTKLTLGQMVVIFIDLGPCLQLLCRFLSSSIGLKSQPVYSLHFLLISFLHSRLVEPVPSLWFSSSSFFFYFQQREIWEHGHGNAGSLVYASWVFG